MTPVPMSMPLLQRASQVIEARLGLHFPPERFADLERGLGNVAKDLDAANDSQLVVERLLDGQWSTPEHDALTHHLTIGETYFFRERCVFDALREHVLPPLIAARTAGDRRLRVWSAGCCTGEEPYSIAMLLEEMIPGIDQWSVSLTGSDINPAFLKLAEAGVYKEWSFRGTTPALRDRYFSTRANSRYEVLQRVRDRVRFLELNLAGRSFPSVETYTTSLDVILCRNVLMYFTQDRMRAVIARLYDCLADGGWLIVSPTEASHYLFRQFESVVFPGAIFYRKNRAASGHFTMGVRATPGPATRAVSPKTPTSAILDDKQAAKPVARSASSQAALPKPERSPTALERAQLLHRVANLAAAESALAEWMQAHPNDATGWALRAQLAADAGRLDEALAWCGKSLTADKMTASVHHLRASVLHELGRWDDADESLKTALYLDPDYALAWLTRGHLALRRHHRVEARKYLTTALQLLRALPADDVLSSSDGLTAARLAEMAESMLTAAA